MAFGFRCGALLGTSRDGLISRDRIGRKLLSGYGTLILRSLQHVGCTQYMATERPFLM